MSEIGCASLLPTKTGGKQITKAGYACGLLYYQLYHLGSITLMPMFAYPGCMSSDTSTLLTTREKTKSSVDGSSQQFAQHIAGQCACDEAWHLQTTEK